LSKLLYHKRKTKENIEKDIKLAEALGEFLFV